jgi:DNA-binding MarR family transcriptional regulator
MAAERSVSRQHVHTLVKELQRDGLVSLAPNPDDRRSKLVALTDKGEVFLEEMSRSEAALLAELGDGIELDELRTATGVLRALRQHLDERSPAPPA